MVSIEDVGLELHAVEIQKYPNGKPYNESAKQKPTN
jgi:hypothetical protein